jgi:hypothetical protein
MTAYDTWLTTDHAAEERARQDAEDAAREARTCEKCGSVYDLPLDSQPCGDCYAEDVANV